MNRVKKGLDNQAIGLLPLLLFMFLDNYIPYFFVSSLNLCCLYTLLLSRKYYWSWR